MIATRPVNQPGLTSQVRSSPALRATSIAVRLLLLACAGGVMQIGWLMVWTFSYRLTHGNDFTYAYLVSQPAAWDKLHALLVLANTMAPGLEGPQGPETLDIIVNSLVMAFVVTGVGYLAAILLVDVGICAVRGAVIVVVLFQVIFQVTLFLTPGLFTTDIFSYVMYGHITAIYNLNPYIYPPNYFPGNPVLQWIHPIWWDQPSVYGPLWTWIGWGMALVAAPLNGVTQTLDDGTVLQIGVMDQVFAYKLLMNLVQVINVILVWWLLGRILTGKPRARLVGLIIFAWSPLMLFDAAGNAHNDALTVTLLLLGVVPLVWRRGEPSNRAWLVGTLCVGLSALIKYTSALVGLFYIVPWARRLRGWRARAAWIGGSGALVLAVTYILFLPWLDFPRALDPMLVALSGKSWMYTNWAPDLLATTISTQLVDPSGLDPDGSLLTVHFWFKAVTRGIFAVYLAWEVVRLWRITGDRDRSLIEPILSASARAFTVLILLVLVWVQDWYWMWPLAMVTLLGWRPMLTKVVVGYTLTCLPMFYVHHYWNTSMPPALVLVYAVPPLVLPLVAWGWQRWIKRREPDRAALANSVYRTGLGAASE